MEFPFEAEAFSSEPSAHDMPVEEGETFVRFVFDLETLSFPRNPVVVDFDHDTKEPVGRATLCVENGLLIARGAFVSAVEGDRAYRLGVTAPGTPFGISPTIDLSEAEVEYVQEGGVGKANGREYQGPIAIYRGAKVLGISICAIPTDAQTSLTVLRKEGLIYLHRIGTIKMSTEIENGLEEIPTDQNNQETLGDESGVADGEPQVRDKELAEFIDEFGLEKGVGFYQRSLGLDEAKMEDYAEMKRLSKTAALSEGCDAPKEEEKKPDDAASLSAKLSALCSRVDILVPRVEAVLKLSAANVKKLGATDSPGARLIPKVAKPTYLDTVRAASGAK